MLNLKQNTFRDSIEAVLNTSFIMKDLLLLQSSLASENLYPIFNYILLKKKLKL